MKKAFLWATLIVFLVAGSFNHADPVSADVSCITKNIIVKVNCNITSLIACNIAGSNYVRLRDVALLLDDSSKQFNITWHPDTQTIKIILMADYIPEKNISENRTGVIAQASPVTANIVCGKSRTVLNAYNVGGSTYLKLRDIGRLLDFQVVYNTSDQVIELYTSRQYNDANSDGAFVTVGEMASYFWQRILLPEYAKPDEFPLIGDVDIVSEQIRICKGFINYWWFQPALESLYDDETDMKRLATRFDVAQLLVGYYGGLSNDETTRLDIKRFSDLTERQYYKLISGITADHLGLLSGYPDGRYRPDAAVTRIEFEEIVTLTIGRVRAVQETSKMQIQ